jgi:hypothetical protein
MKSGSILLLCVILALAAGCGGGGGGSSASGAPAAAAAPAVSLPNGLILPQVVGNNVLALTIDGSECSAATVAQWPNKPCVSITICDPSDSGNCQTVNDILLDTGDYGVRIFQQVLPASLITALGLNPVQVDSLPVYECVEYGDGSKVWGPVETASVVLAGEPAVNVPIQVIGSSAGNPSQVCRGSFSSPTTALYNGSLGLGFFLQDCGPVCASSDRNRVYYTCSGGRCTGAAVPLDSQVHNPVASLPVDNNGVALLLPSVPSGGTPSATGYLVLGIGTQSNNSPSGVVAYGADQNGNFTTVFNNVTYESFLDSGSNGFFFTDNAIQGCGDWFCPVSPSTLTLSAATTASAGSPSGSVQFQITNYDSLSSSNNVFSNIGGSLPDLFDWGLPFFLGRNVYAGIEGTTSSLGMGPYWAY